MIPFICEYILFSNWQAAACEQHKKGRYGDLFPRLWVARTSLVKQGDLQPSSEAKVCRSKISFFQQSGPLQAFVRCQRLTMSRDRRRWEGPTSSHWEPGYGRSCDEYSWRHYSPPTEPLPRRSFNYWRDEAVAPTSSYPQRSSGRQNSNGQWRDDSRSWHTESSYSRRQRDSGPARYMDDLAPRRDRSPPHRNPPRQHHSTHTPPPYIPRPTFRARSPVESTPSFPGPVSPALPRKTSAPPIKSSQPRKPSPEYLALSQEPSEVLQDPRANRKLLVLDLNGTLLIRSPRSRASSRPQLRPVQPRPYMQSFRQYLFCLETKAWLATMVWSSAQPHSVDDMVDKVFGATKNELKAVWNRKSLGLSEAEYRESPCLIKSLVEHHPLWLMEPVSYTCPDRRLYSRSEVGHDEGPYEAK